jgi:hypothetical protein
MEFLLVGPKQGAVKMECWPLPIGRDSRHNSGWSTSDEIVLQLVRVSFHWFFIPLSTVDALSKAATISIAA